MQEGLGPMSRVFHPFPPWRELHPLIMTSDGIARILQVAARTAAMGPPTTNLGVAPIGLPAMGTAFSVRVSAWGKLKVSKERFPCAFVTDAMLPV